MWNVAAMKVQSVRFGGYQWRLVTDAAEKEGVSAAQFIRDAAYARAVMHYLIQDQQGERHELGFALELSKALSEHRDLRDRLEGLLNSWPEDESEGELSPEDPDESTDPDAQS